ncbi:MAG TPA: 2-hydroxychromene-2-carboxylate isomerase [Rhodocyclaceae bacterium]
MSSPIDFYFDFSSPYGYLASEKIDELAAKHGRTVRWKPVLLGVIFKTTGAAPLLNVPLKGDYAKIDIARSARSMNIPYRLPASFPQATQQAARAFYALDDADPALARRFAHAAYRAIFVDGRDISAADTVLEIAGACGADTETLAAAIATPEIKERLRREVEEAMAAGVFGSPYMMVDGEPFMGADRLPQLERWLAEGPF